MGIWRYRAARFFEPVAEDIRRLARWCKATFGGVDWTDFRADVDRDKPFFDYAKNVLALVAWWGAIVLIFRNFPDTTLTLLPFALFGLLLFGRLFVTTLRGVQRLESQMAGSKTWLGRVVWFIAKWAFGFAMLAVFYMFYQAATGSLKL